MKIVLLFLKYIQIGLDHIINILYLSFLCNILGDESRHFKPGEHSPEDPLLRAGAHGGQSPVGQEEKDPEMGMEKQSYSY